MGNGQGSSASCAWTDNMYQVINTEILLIHRRRISQLILSEGAKYRMKPFPHKPSSSPPSGIKRRVDSLDYRNLEKHAQTRCLRSRVLEPLLLRGHTWSPECNKATSVLQLLPNAQQANPLPQFRYLLPRTMNLDQRQQNLHHTSQQLGLPNRFQIVEN